MKEYDSFDNTLFMKLICVMAAIALVCVVVFVIIGAVDSGTQTPEETDNGYETYLFPETNAPTTTAAPTETTAAPADTTAAPDDTTVAHADTTTAPAETTAAVGSLTPLPASSVILAETTDMSQSYIDEIIFFGDSTTYGMGPYAVLKDGKQTTQVWTPVNGTLTLDQAVKKKIKYPETGEEITAAEAAAAKLPKYMVITLGVNGVSFMNEEQFITEYVKLVQSIQAASPSTKIMLQSIFPVASNYEKLDAINNEKISLANTWVLKVAEQCGVKYLDTASVLHDTDGWLFASFQNGDGMHFNADGYKVVLDYIRTHGYAE
ncbi:MAG: SGNH/GDSL hydrolase family protein [Clostridia bacterium]|nr:SGNH/GDSL hydrolase family protein [Clostridia bacterium]